MTGKEGWHLDHAAAGAAPHVAVGNSAVNPDALEVVPGTEHERLEGWIPALASEEELRVALEKAFDYRGDVTITRKDGAKIEGYLFDRRTGSFAARVGGESLSQEFFGEDFDLVCGDCGARVFGARYGGGEKLGSLDEEVRGEEGRGREGFEFASGDVGVGRLGFFSCGPRSMRRFTGAEARFIF